MYALSQSTEKNYLYKPFYIFNVYFCRDKCMWHGTVPHTTAFIAQASLQCPSLEEPLYYKAFTKLNMKHENNDALKVQ